MRWDIIRAFLALHRFGTFDGAAKVLSIDQTTLRRHIQALEQSFGMTLFTRQSGAYVVTPQSEHLLEAAYRMENYSQVFFEQRNDGASGTVRVTAPDFFASFMASDLAEFRELYPAIMLDISTEHYFVDLEKEMVDVAVRLARPIRGESKISKIGTLQYNIYKSTNRSSQETISSDTSHNLLNMSVHFNHNDHDVDVGSTDWMLSHLPPGTIVSCTDSFLTLRKMCEAGMGLALLPNILGDTSRHLTRTFPERTVACDIWLVVHADTGHRARVRVFTEFMKTAFRKRLLAL